MAKARTSSRRHVPKSRSRRSQPPKAPGTQAASRPVPGMRSCPSSWKRSIVAADGSDTLSAEDERLVALHREEHGGNLPARPVQVRLDDLQREAGRHRRIERVPAALEHRHPDRRRQPVRRRDHAERSTQLRTRRELHVGRTLIGGPLTRRGPALPPPADPCLVTETAPSRSLGRCTHHPWAGAHM